MRQAVYTSLSASVGDSASAQGLTPEDLGDLLELPLVAVLTDDAVGRRAGNPPDRFRFATVGNTARVSSPDADEVAARSDLAAF
jgi:hypothetical protein